MSKSKRGYVNNPEEVVKIAAEGLEKHRKAGNVVTLDKPAQSLILDEHGEPIADITLSRENRRILSALVEQAIYCMATGSFQKWSETLEVIRELLMAAGWPNERIMGVFKGIETEAILDCGNRLQGEIARTWLAQKKDGMLH